MAYGFACEAAIANASSRCVSRLTKVFPVALWLSVKAKMALSSIAPPRLELAWQRGSHRNHTRNGWPKPMSYLSRFSALKLRDAVLRRLDAIIQGTNHRMTLPVTKV